MNAFICVKPKSSQSRAAISLLYLWQIDKGLESVPVTLLMGLSLQVCMGDGQPRKALLQRAGPFTLIAHTNTTSDVMSCASET